MSSDSAARSTGAARSSAEIQAKNFFMGCFFPDAMMRGEGFRAFFVETVTTVQCQRGSRAEYRNRGRGNQDICGRRCDPGCPQDGPTKHSTDRGYRPGGCQKIADGDGGGGGR